VKASNEKVGGARKRIIAEALAAPDEEAARLFEESGHQVKVAIVMGKLGMTRPEAEEQLMQVSGHVRFAIGEGA